jgi:CheY-like chemotaxis protein
MPKKTIMVIDDEYIILESVKEILKKEGYDVITALSGAEALSMLKKTKVDLILTDLMMPNMGGLELTRKIREEAKLKNIDIMYLSVITLSEEQKKKLKRFKILGYIQKPFDSEDLIKSVNKTIKKQKR